MQNAYLVRLFVISTSWAPFSVPLSTARGAGEAHGPSTIGDPVEGRDG